MRDGRDEALRRRMTPFLERGFIRAVPTRWQLACGAVEMAPYVLAPDAGDAARYAGAPLGHPVVRQSVLLSQIGRQHLHVGHGLGVSLDGLVAHLNFVHHEGMPVYDLQLVQTHPGGLARLRREMAAVDRGASRRHARRRRLIDLVIPRASRYRARFLQPDGWIDRAAAFDYPAIEGVAGFLRPEFTQLTTFADYCTSAFAPRPPRRPSRVVRELAALATRRLRRVGLVEAPEDADVLDDPRVVAA